MLAVGAVRADARTAGPGSDGRRPDPGYHCLRGRVMQGSSPARPVAGPDRLAAMLLLNEDGRLSEGRRRKR